MKTDPANSQPTDFQSVPKAVVGRLSLYLRELQHLTRDGIETTNSKHLGILLGVTPSQVRKDLAYFGQFGYPGIGYRCSELIGAIKQIMGTDAVWSVALIGIGNLGRALLRYKGFNRQGFRIVAAFDADPNLVGQTVEGVDVYPMHTLTDTVRQQNIRLAAIAVPAEASQQVADMLIDSGVEGILNFAPVMLSLPDTIQAVGVDLAMELEQLAFTVVNNRKND